MKSLLAAAFVTASLFTGACASTHGYVYAQSGPPPSRYERVGVAPGPGYVWIPGYYRYGGGGYAWVGGRWDRPPRSRAPWVPGHWQRDRRGWYYVEGHWR